MQIKFNNSKNFIYLTAYCLYQNKVSITGEGITENLSGFILYEDDEKTVVRDCSDYKYKWNIYTEYENGIVLTNSETDREQEPILLTQEQIEENLKTSKENKILESKKMLEQYLSENPILSYSHNSTPAFYSVTQEKQMLMMSQYTTYKIEKNLNSNAILTWNETGKECEEWTEEEFLQLILEIKQYVYPLVSYQQSIEMHIKNCTTQEEVSAVNIDFKHSSIFENTNK